MTNMNTTTPPTQLIPVRDILAAAARLPECGNCSAGFGMFVTSAPPGSVEPFQWDLVVTHYETCPRAPITPEGEVIPFRPTGAA